MVTASSEPCNEFQERSGYELEFPHVLGVGLMVTFCLRHSVIGTAHHHIAPEWDWPKVK